MRSRRDRLRGLYEHLLAATISILSGQGLAIAYIVYTHIVKSMNVWLVTALTLLQGLAAPLIYCTVLLYRVDSEIRQIDNMLLDPETMPTDRWLIIAMLLTGLAFTIVGTIIGLATLGVIHL